MPSFSGLSTDLYQGSTVTNSNGTEDTFELLREALGHPEMVRASTCEKVRRVKSTGPADKSFSVQYHTSGWTKSEHWSSYANVESLLELQGLYFKIFASTMQTF